MGWQLLQHSAVLEQDISVMDLTKPPTPFQGHSFLRASWLLKWVYLLQFLPFSSFLNFVNSLHIVPSFDVVALSAYIKQYFSLGNWEEILVKALWLISQWKIPDIVCSIKQLTCSSESYLLIKAIYSCVQHNRWHHGCYIVKLLLLGGKGICFPLSSFTDLWFLYL